MHIHEAGDSNYSLDACIVAGWSPVAVTLCWGQSDIRRYIFQIESRVYLKKEKT